MSAHDIENKLTAAEKLERYPKLVANMKRLHDNDRRELIMFRLKYYELRNRKNKVHVFKNVVIFGLMVLLTVITLRG